MKKKIPNTGAFRWREGGGHRPADIVVDADGEGRGGVVRDAESAVSSVIKNAGVMLVVAGAPAASPDVIRMVGDGADTGVRPYVLADGAGAGRDAARSLGGRALVRYSDGPVAGAIIADPRTNPGGILLSGGPGGAGICVALSRRQAQDAYSAARWAFWERAAGEFVDGSVRRCRGLGEVKPPEGTWVRMEAAGCSGISNRVREMLQNDNKRITILNPRWDSHSSLADGLCRASRAGADVLVITQKEGQAPPVLQKMIRAGIRVVGFEGMGARAIVTDGPCLVASGGLERGAGGFHMGAELNGAQCGILRKAVDEWAAGPQFRYESEAGAAKP